jgi:hypothetical protein
MFTLNSFGTCARKDGTNEWHSVTASPEYLAWVAAGNTPAPYVAPVPQTVTMRQANRALLAAGLLDAVNAAIAQSPREAQIDWERAQDVERDNPLVASLAGVLGLDSAALDNLFTVAAGL